MARASVKFHIGVGDYRIIRRRLQSTSIERYRQKTTGAFFGFSDVPREAILWWTGIFAAKLIDPGDHAAWFRDVVEHGFSKLRRRTRTRLKGSRMRGVVEVDFVRPGAALICPQKIQTIRALGVSPEEATAGQRIAIVHLHAVIDCGDFDPAFVKEQLHVEFSGPRQTLAKPLYATSTVRENLEALASYSSKMSVCDLDAWTDRPSRFGEQYDEEWMDTFVSMIAHDGLEALRFSH